MNKKFLTSFLLIVFTFIPAYSQSFDQTISSALGSYTSTSKLLQLMLFISLISIAPSILIMVTSFSRIAIVLSILRSALGLQNVPSNQIIVALSLFLSFFIMNPVLQQSWNKGISPLINQQISEEIAIKNTIEPIKKFMILNTSEREINYFADYSRLKDTDIQKNKPLRVIIPAFMLSELKKAFQIGFIIYIPFLIIDLVVASILMSMGMMMLPPAMISLPFKLIFFVLADGWNLITGNLIKSFYI